MFDPAPHPRLFGLAPGVDFPRALVSGVLHRMRTRPPEDLARVRLIVNTRRMQRRLKSLFAEQGALLLPRIGLVTELDALDPRVTLPPAISPLRRRLELIQLVSKLLDQQKDLAARSSLYDLTDSLASLLDEMQGEGVSADTIAGLDVSDQSGHWERAQAFIRIAQDYIDQDDGPLIAEARQRQMVDALASTWAEDPLKDPLIIAGSTGSRGTTLKLMKVVARLPQGAIVLPGFDFEMAKDVWLQLEAALLSQDHPQYRFLKLMGELGLQRKDVAPWDPTPPPNPARNALVSLSLRPAPFTDAWLTEGPKLTSLEDACKGVTLVQAQTPRIEAVAIAMRLRKAVEDGQTAALISPDRMLTRQVTAALDQWGILPDDSAGSPLHLSPPGRFLRHVAALFHRRLDAEALLTLLKHPLASSGAGRNDHMLNTHRLDMAIRTHGLPYPDGPGILRLMRKACAGKSYETDALVWAEWVGKTLCQRQITPDRELSDWVDDHLGLATALAAGPEGTDSGLLWARTSGEEAQKVMNDLTAQARYGGAMSASDYADLAGALLASAEIRESSAPRPDIMIWGTLEARVQGADLVILGGLNDGTWPEAPPPDPWLNRKMRLEAGLLLPERRIGLSAHDYQQAIAAPEVWLTRSIRSDDAETVASRWLNRLCNLMEGLKDTGGNSALTGMIARGDAWLSKVGAFEHVDRCLPAPRPSPRPPVESRPKRMSVTEIKTLIRDPYAIFARHVLRLQPLGDLVQAPDALIRGTLVHEIMESFVKDVTKDPDTLTREHLFEVARNVLEEHAPWPTARAMWLSKVDRIADWFVDTEKQRRALARPVALEHGAKGQLTFDEIGFELTARADRIDQTVDGAYLIYDYKSGTPPTKPQQKQFDKQLLIMAAMIECGCFRDLSPGIVDKAAYIGLGSSPKVVPAPLEEEPTQEVLAELRHLITAYSAYDRGYTSRRMMEKDRFGGTYDQLARFGEWDATDDPVPEDLT